uniref:FAD/NAD(P)-binding domain-containing protein n=2 Tax=Photinus pyralis TaxID=7054 RepID=A0A1Y1N9G6_PHOPY
MHKEKIKHLGQTHLLPTMKNVSSEVIHKDVVIIGNGPSGLALSYMLSGNIPYLISTSHPDDLLSARLGTINSNSLVHQDLLELANGLEGRSTNPISLLLDSLAQPYADMGLELTPLIEWRKEGNEIDHVVLGKGPPGGSWHDMDPNILTLSLGTWMALPGLPYRARDGSEKRASAGNVAKYYSQYVKEMQLEKYFKTGICVTRIRQLDEPSVTCGPEPSKIKKMESDGEPRRPKICSLSNALNFIRLRANRKCKRRRDALVKNEQSPDRKIREVVLKAPNQINWRCQEALETVPFSYSSPVNRSVNVSCDFDSFQSPCDSFCGKFFNEHGSFFNQVKSSCHSSTVPHFLNNCDNDSDRLKENCDPATFRGSNPKWLVETYDAITGGYVTYTCNYLVLANGTSDLPNRLSLPENQRSPHWMVHDVRSLELNLDRHAATNSNPEPVLVIGAGLSAADAIIATRCRDIPVLHLFRHKNGDLGKKLPENMYPEYHKVHQMMQDGGSTYPLYTALPECTLTDIDSEKRIVSIKTKSGEKLTFNVSFAAVLIGAHSDLSFVPDNFNLGVNKNLPIDNKANNIDINKLNYSVTGINNLYAMGPLAGDNFVRFIPGGALAIVSDLYKKYGY